MTCLYSENQEKIQCYKCIILDFAKYAANNNSQKGFLNTTLILQLCNPAGENIEVRIADILDIFL